MDIKNLLMEVFYVMVFKKHSSLLWRLARVVVQKIYWFYDYKQAGPFQEGYGGIADL